MIVEFVPVDNPHAKKLTVHILAPVAQHEREMTAQRQGRTASRQGSRCCNPKLDAVRDRAVASVKADADRGSRGGARI
jgi:hypothetical protein